MTGEGRDLDFAAKMTGISKHTLRLYVRRRLIGHYRIGRRIVFSDGDIADFLARHRVPAHEAREVGRPA
jgi:excisionase family DNA binding protein